MTIYPQGIDGESELPITVDKNTPVSAAVVNRLRSAIIAIESELGIKPSGTSSTIRARLDDSDFIFQNAGGDLDGSFPSPTVVKIQGNPIGTSSLSPGHVLKWNGSEWNGAFVTVEIDDLTITSQARGDIIYFNGAEWTRLGAGTSGYVLTTQGPSADPIWTLVSGGGGSSNINDLTISGQAQGDIIYFNGTQWTRLGAGTNGHFLKTQGVGANPTWAVTASGFTAAGDLDGDETSQTVISLTGASGVVNILADELKFDSALGSIQIYQSNSSLGGGSIALSGQGSYDPGGAGGGVSINGGTTLGDTSAGGTVILRGGSTYGTGSSAGSILLFGGDSFDSTGGGITLNAGNGNTLGTISLNLNFSNKIGVTDGTTILQNNDVLIESDLSIGSTSSTNVSINSRVDTSLVFLKEGNYTINVDTTTTLNTVGGGLTIRAGEGNGTGNGGASAFIGGTSSTGTGGQTTIQGGESSGVRGGHTFIYGGSGLSGADAGNLYLNSGFASFGAHGTLYLNNATPANVRIGQTTSDIFIEGDLSLNDPALSTNSYLILDGGRHVATTATLDINDLAITSQAQGDISYYNGTIWTRLAASTSGHVLTTNGVGANPSWTPAATGFTAGGDLTGSSSSQQVVALTGTSGVVSFANSVTTPTINQTLTSTASATGQALKIQAQNATGTTSTGGQLTLTSGTGTSTDGSVVIQTGGTSKLTVTSSVLTIATGVAVKMTGPIVADYIVLSSDYYIYTGTLSAPITITLPSSTGTGRTYIIKDANGNAATHNITVSGSPWGIDGLGNTFVIDSNYSAYTFTYNGSKWIIS